MIPYQGIFVRDHWEELTDKPWWLMSGYEPEELAQVLIRAAESVGTDIVEVWTVPGYEWRQNHRIVIEDGRPFDLDTASGVRSPLVRPTDRTTEGSAPSNPVRDLSELNQRWPLRSADEMLADGSLDLAQRLVRRLGDQYAMMGAVSSPIWTTFSCLGLMRGLMAICDEPELFAALCDRFFAQALERLTALATVGIDLVWLEDCYTSRDILGLNHFCQYVMPANQQIIAHCHQVGLRVIHYFCGDVEDRLELLASAKPDAIGLEETKKQFNLDLARLAPRLPVEVCVLGNVDAIHLLPNCTLAELECEVRRQAQVSLARGSFVLSLGSPVTPGTTLKRVREFTDLGHSVASWRGSCARAAC